MILVVDGGNSKTDLALLADDGALIAHARGPLSSPHHIGLDGCLAVLQQLVDEVGLDGRSADLGLVLLAGLDFPEEEDELELALGARPWFARTRVGNDTFAVLRAGTDSGFGVAITCGAGINCVGVGRDGRHVRFPALGEISGDWGGGYDVGLAAVSAAARSGDLRGPQTVLEELVPAYFGCATPLELAHAIHRGRIERRRVMELAPLVLRAAATDEVAAEIVDRLADEIVALAGAAVARLDPDDAPVDVIVGGGLIRSGDERLLARIEDGVGRFDVSVHLQRASAPPVVGAALLALDEVRANGDAHERARRELSEAVVRLETREAH